MLRVNRPEFSPFLPLVHKARVNLALKFINIFTAASISNLQALHHLQSGASQSELKPSHHGSSSSLASTASSGGVSQTASNESKDSKDRENKLNIPNISHQRWVELDETSFSNVKEIGRC